MPPLEILYEDNHLLVVNKPAGIATMGVESGPTVHAMAANYLKRAYNKPGRAFVGIVSRLDTMTSGVLVLARTSKAAQRLTDQFSGRSGRLVEKHYLAAVEGKLEEASGIWSDDLVKDDRARRMRIAGTANERTKLATLSYRVVAAKGNRTIVLVRLLTGRKHQIRVQFADRDHPVVGDRKYGSTFRFPVGIALHSWRLQIEHPTKREPIQFEAPLPGSWRQLSLSLPLLDNLRNAALPSESQD